MLSRLGAAAAGCAACGVGGARHLFGQAFDVGEIEAVRRGMSGSRSAQWARRNKLIPGIIYGPDDQGRRTIPEKIYVREADLKRELNKRGGSFTNTLMDMYVWRGRLRWKVASQLGEQVRLAALGRVSALTGGDKRSTPLPPSISQSC